MPAGKRGLLWSESHSSSYTYQNLIILVSKFNFCYNLNVCIKKKLIQFNFNGSFGD